MALIFKDVQCEVNKKRQRDTDTYRECKIKDLIETETDIELRIETYKLEVFKLI